nr:hypothetical protein [Tanacetum cinerariifolium]
MLATRGSGKVITMEARDNNRIKSMRCLGHTLLAKQHEEIFWIPTLCTKCNYHHNGQCAPKCDRCKKVSHMARDCRNSTIVINQGTRNCFKCRKQGHYKSDCPKLKNRNHGNQAGGTKACGMVYALGGGETN